VIRTERGDIWAYEKSTFIVVPVNIGYRRDGANPMGRGVALEAARRYPDFPAWFGAKCLELGAETPVLRCHGTPLLAFPTKPFNRENPAMSWKSRADLGLIERSAKQLAQWPGNEPIALPLPGCGNGGLDMSEVRPILDKHLSDGRFVLVLWENDR